jgi:anaerobic ribonucleoside-triphosphate reductase activating protein
LIAWRESDGLDFDILCYSGLPLKRLEREHAPLLRLIDALCPEPFVEKRSAPVTWRGSSNQPLVALNERGQRVADLAPLGVKRKRFQLDVTAGRVWFIGIPQRDDMEKLERLAAARGLALTGVSWRA